MLSYSTMGSAGGEVAKKVQDTKFCKRRPPSSPSMATFSLTPPSSPPSPSSSSWLLCRRQGQRSYSPTSRLGNIGYKLVQRSPAPTLTAPSCRASLPVNDLSRGCSADDIVGVVAITAVQARWLSSGRTPPKAVRANPENVSTNETPRSALRSYERGRFWSDAPARCFRIHFALIFEGPLCPTERKSGLTHARRPSLWA